MSKEGLSLDDWLDNDEIIPTDDPEFKAGSGDPGELTPNDDDDEIPVVVTDDDKEIIIEGLDGRKAVTEPVAAVNPIVTPVLEVTNVLGAFLESYGIIGGVLDTSNGEKKFDELTPEEQLKALTQVVEHNRPVDKRSELTTDEQNLLKSIRDSKLTVEDFIVKSSQEYQMLEQTSVLFDAPEYKFEDMDKDIIYAAYIRANNQEISEEALEDELKNAKKSAIYDSTVEILRKTFIDNRESQKSEYIKTHNERNVSTAKINAERYVAAANKTDDIAGWTVSKDEKNGILEEMVEIDSVGKTKFVRDLVENPENAFKAMWHMKYAEEKFNKIDEYYKSKLQEIYSKGLTDGAAGKTQSTRKNAVKEKEINKIIQSTDDPDVGKLEDWLNS